VTRQADRVELVYREQGPRIWRAVFAYCGDREIASDAVAEAFAQLLRRGDSVRDPVAWTWRAAFRIAAGELKGRNRMTHRFEGFSIDIREPASDLIEALARLSPKQRAALILHHYAGYPFKDVARILGSTVGAVKVHASVGRKRLGRLLEEVHDA
jgi:DNA-directed RNA polymerase specialized sigma24 family protein